MSASSERLHALDGLRGIAAFVVLLSHCWLVMPDGLREEIPLWLSFTPLRLLVNGYAGVILFFVLSGYVLSLPFIGGKDQPWPSFAIKRLCRIYIPFAVAICCAALLYALSHPVKPELASDWFREEWMDAPLTGEIVARHLFMLGRMHDMWLDGVMWSLIVELRISLIFPILMVLCRGWRSGLCVAAALYVGCVAATIATGRDWSMITSDTFGGTVLITLRFVPFFMTGILLAKYNAEIQKMLDALPRWAFAGLLLIALGLLCLPTKIHNQQIAALLSVISGETLPGYIAEVGLGVGASIIIVMMRRFGQSGLFSAGIFKGLGTISYSLYLVHLPLVLFLFRVLLGQIDFIWIVLASIAASLATATAFYVLVERPAMTLGRRLTRSMTGGRATIQ